MSESEGKAGKRSRRRVSITNEKESSNRAIVACPKNDGQKNVLRAINENKVTLIDGVAGTGKAQPLTAKIYTPSGYKLMAEIQLNDDVITPDGGTAKVVGIFPQGIKKMYRIHFEDGGTVEACGEHLWKVNRLGASHLKPKILDTDYIRTHLTAKNGRNLWAIDCPKPLQFTQRDLLIDPYVMGVLLGDGGITQSVTVSSEDEEVLCGISSSLAAGYHLRHAEGCDYKVVKKVRGGRSDYIDALRHYGLFGRKSEEKHIPDDYLYNSVEARVSLLQGMMDTDGEVEVTGGCRYTTTSPKLAAGFQELVHCLGGVCRMSEKYPTYTYKGEKLNGRVAYSISVQFPNHKDLFRLSRKKNAARTTGRLGTKRIIVGVEQIENVAAQCIMLDSPEHLYVTDGGVVTHNTYISVTYGLQMLFRGKYKRIIVSRPMVEAGERLGFLPGTMAEKTAPLLMPIFDSFREHLSQMDIDELIEEGRIVILPIAFMRGVTFKDSYVVCDEAQNCTLKQIHMLLTRLGDNSKIVVTGDPSQSDIGEFTGYARAISLVDGIQGLEVIKLDKSCVVRDPIVGEIDERFAFKM